MQPLRRDQLRGVHRHRRRRREDPRVLPVPGARQLLGPEHPDARMPSLDGNAVPRVRAVAPPGVPRRTGAGPTPAHAPTWTASPASRTSSASSPTSPRGKGASNPLTALDVADAIVPKLKVDQQLSKQDIFQLVNTFRKVNPNDSSAIQMQTIPVQAAPPPNAARLVLKQPEADSMLAQLRTFGAVDGPGLHEAAAVAGPVNGARTPRASAARRATRSPASSATASRPAGSATPRCSAAPRSTTARATTPRPCWSRAT